jgi:redox-sensitive bicupin YhaK (pirin superfamily)
MSPLSKRPLLQTVNAMAASDGDGVKISRLAGRQLNAAMDPFLMLDEINSDAASDYVGGFPSHPHRGFETITYMKAGRMRHRDHMGNEGVIEAGDVQWMTAGRGVIHSEMPEQEQGLLHGFQIWLNLPADEKMKPAAYRDIRSAEIAQAALASGTVVRSIAGDIEVADPQHSDAVQTVHGALPAFTTEPVLADVMLPSGAAVDLSFAGENPAMVYVYGGSTLELNQRQMGFYGPGDRLLLQAGSEGARALVLAGKPLAEPIAQYGPFVMNTREQLEQALEDYQHNRLVQ